MLYNERAIKKVLTCLYLDNDLIISSDYPLRLNDFALKKYQAIYSSLYNLYSLGNSSIDISDIIGYFQQQSTLYAKFVEDGGMDVLYEICNDATSPNFEYNYKAVKKYALLTDLQNGGIDISDLYDVSLPVDKLEEQLSKFNAMEVEDIFKHYNIKLNNIQNKYDTFLEKTCITAADGIEELMKQLQTIPEVGLPLEGEIYNTVTRGARLKKLYIDSGSSGSGKSRRMAGNATHLAIPMYYNTESGEWINTGCSNKVLYITTELEHAEVQTLVLAYMTGINEEKILNNKCSDNEKQILELAVEYLKENNNLIIEYLPDPTIIGIKTIIKKHVLQDDVKYVFYDYIHIGSGLIANRDKQMRDDIILLLLTNTLKELANELDIHISTATQLNGEYEEKEVKNENLIRGSKAVADKADIGAITLRCNMAEEELGRAIALKTGTIPPNFITDIYKNRRGKWTGIRIWRYIDLGTCRTIDCFITDRKGNPLDFDNIHIQVKQANHKGGFVVKEKESKEVDFDNFGTMILTEDYIESGK